MGNQKIPLSAISGAGSAAAKDTGTAAGQVVELLDNDGTPSLPAVDGSRLLNLPSGGNFKVVSGVIRPNASGVWDFISDLGHAPLNCDSITQNDSSKRIEINYASAGFTKIHSFHCQGDEQLSQYFNFGPSVGTGFASISIRPINGVSGRVFFSGGGHTIDIKNVTGTFDATPNKQMRLKIPFWCNAKGAVLTNRYTGSDAYHSGNLVIRNSSETVAADKTKPLDFRWMADASAGGGVLTPVDGFGAHIYVPPLDVVRPIDFVSGANNVPTSWNSINMWFMGVFS